MSEVMNAEQVAELLQVPRSTLTNWRYQGVGPIGFRVGKHVRYRRSDVEAWIDGQVALEQRSA